MMSEIVVVIFDNLTSRIQHLRSRLLDLAEFKSRGPYDIIVTNNINTELKNLSEKYNYAVVIALGSAWNTVQEITDSVQYAKDMNSPLIAHILEKDPYYEFHPQWFVLNLQIYKSYNYPELSSTETIESKFINVIRSTENFHHEYTPHWIKASEGDSIKVIPKEFFGVKLIDTLLRNGHVIYNIPNYIRDKKSFCYPEQNADEIYQAMVDINYSSPTLDAHFNWLVRGQRSNVYDGVGFYPANTEPIECYNKINIRKKFNYFAGVAGGFKPALLTNRDYFTDNVRIVIFDYSDAALNWQKLLYTKWDGNIETLESLFVEFRSTFPNCNPIISLQVPFLEKIKEILQEQGVDIKQLKSAWTKYQSQSVEFRKLDLLDVSSIETFTNDLQDPGTNAYLWFSNVFYMDWQMFFYGKESMQKQLENYCNELVNRSNAFIAVEHCNILQVYPPKR